MSKLTVILILFFCLRGTGLLAQDLPPSSWSIGVQGPELITKLTVLCCPSTGKPCDDLLNEKNMILVKSVIVHIYNLGSKQSDQATGEIEFYDSDGDKKTFNFTIPPVKPKNFAFFVNNQGYTANSIDWDGPFLIKKLPGITVKITYKNLRGISTTKSFTYSGCGVSGWSKKNN